MAAPFFTSLTKQSFITCTTIIGITVTTFMLFSTRGDVVEVANRLFHITVDENAARRLREEKQGSVCDKIKPDVTFVEGQSVFEDFNNATGANCFIVPNIIHFIRFNKTEYSFTDYIVLLAAMRNHRPDWFYIHTDVPKFNGTYWEKIKDDPEISKRIRIKHFNITSKILGKSFSRRWPFYHDEYVARLLVMMQYGGIYLDNDVFVIRSLDKYRKYEIAMNWDENQFLASPVIIANKDARLFLSLWLDGFHEYYSNSVGEGPTTELFYRRLGLVHCVKGAFGANTDVSSRLYTVKSYDGWRELDAIPMLLGHRSYLDPNYNKTPTFTEENINTYEYPFGTMVRELLDEYPM